MGNSGETDMKDLEIRIQSFMYFKSMYCIAYVWFCFVSEKTDVQSVGMIAGAVTGMVAGALLIFLLVWLLIRRKDKRDMRKKRDQMKFGKPPTESLPHLGYLLGPAP